VFGNVCREIADNLSKAGSSWGCVSAIDSNGRTIWIADSHRGDGNRFVVHADEKLTALFGIWNQRFEPGRAPKGLVAREIKFDKLSRIK
jgi:hypothetical protein